MIWCLVRAGRPPPPCAFDWQSVLGRSMAGISDSQVTFTDRCKPFGLAQENVDDLIAKGVRTYGQLLFRVASGPNQVDEAKLNDLISSCKPDLSESGPRRETPGFRRFSRN